MIRYSLVCIGILAAFALGYSAGKSADSAPAASRADSSFNNSMELLNATSTTEKNGDAGESYLVVKVIDGDTFVASIGGKNVTIRLIGIDTPETVDPRKTVQCFGKEASEKARALLSGQSVRLESDATQGEIDKYGRSLMYAFLQDGTNVAEYLIVEGYGHEYTYNLPYKYQPAFQAAEKKARIEKRGLWADDACANDGFTKPVIMPDPAASGTYECSRNAYNCSSFNTQSEAQAAFDSCGGSSNDVHKLDADLDGRVCESLP